MRKRGKLLSLLLIVCLLLNMGIKVSANTTVYSIEQINQILLRSGMSQEELDEIDDEVKRLIIEKSGTELEYVRLSATPELTRSGDAPIALSCPIFRVLLTSGEYVYDFYPTYESTEKIEPQGNDAFAFVVGDGMRLVEDNVGGTLYARLENDDSWERSHALEVSSTSLYGYSFKGSQLGTPDFPIYLRGNCYFRAEPYSSEPDLRVNLKYVYDTTGSINYSIGLTIGYVTVSVNSGIQTGGLLEQSENFAEVIE